MRYNCTAWLEKNKDPLNETAVEVLKSATGNQLILDVWADYRTQEELIAEEKAGGKHKKGKSASFMTVSMMYRLVYKDLTNCPSTLVHLETEELGMARL